VKDFFQPKSLQTIPLRLITVTYFKMANVALPTKTISARQTTRKEMWRGLLKCQGSQFPQGGVEGPRRRIKN